MPEDQNANGEHWTRESVAILKQLGWTQRGTSNFDIECVHHSVLRRGQGHGVDSFFTYYDPYYQSDQGILVESKNWQFNSMTTENIKKWVKQITVCIECMQVSSTIQDLTQAPIQNALLMCWANDSYDQATFTSRLKDVSIAGKKYECNIYVASNYEILKWCSLINTINELKRNSKEFKFIYPNIPTLGTNLVKADHITLVHLYSKYIFAQSKVERYNVSGGTDVVDQTVVFCFEPASAASLDFLYDLVKQLNLQASHEYIFYFYERETTIRQVVGEFKNRVASQVRGDILNPSLIIIKYLDIFNGLQNVPDNIIHFGEERI